MTPSIVWLVGAKGNKLGGSEDRLQRMAITIPEAYALVIAFCRLYPVAARLTYCLRNRRSTSCKRP